MKEFKHRRNVRATYLFLKVWEVEDNKRIDGKYVLLMNCSIVLCVYSAVVLNMIATEVTVIQSAIPPGERNSRFVLKWRLFRWPKPTSPTVFPPSVWAPSKWSLSLVWILNIDDIGLSSYKNPTKGKLYTVLIKARTVVLRVLKIIPVGLKALIDERLRME